MLRQNAKSNLSSAIEGHRLSQGYDQSPSGQKKISEVLIERERLSRETLKRMIREMGFKVTEQRLTILAALARGRAHVSAQEVFERVSKQYPDIGFATVYRFLRDLTERKRVTELRMGGMPARYELTPKAHHDHLTCTECGKIVEFENKDIEVLQCLVAKNNGFQLTGHVLELYGVCPDCQSSAD
jgi:Fur family transcriptional regulator, ferric uptake regulator